MQAIILAGGFGTRLKSKINDLPKPMAPIRGIPFLSFILNQLDKQGFNKVVLAVGYMSEKIVSFYGNKFKNIDIEYSYEDEPLGTGGCVKKAIEMINENYAFVINGDTYFNINYSEIPKPNHALIVCKYKDNPIRYGKVIINKSVIKSFNEKGDSSSGYINGGIYYFNKTWFENMELPYKFSMEKDFFEKFVENINIESYISDQYFIDIGIPEDYEKAERELHE